MQVKFIKTILLILIWSTIVTAQSIVWTDPELEGDYFEGDMILTEEQERWLTSPIQARNGLKNPKYRWPDATMQIRISPKFSDDDYDLIMEAMDDIENRSCVYFEGATKGAKAYVKFVQPKRGCASAVGFNNEVQNILLSKNCMTKAHIQHELMHAFGFLHQQSVADRDKYVKINYENIKKGREHNFRKYAQNKTDDFGVGYDFESIMHYSAYHFTRNNKKTIEPLDPRVKIGRKTSLSDKDILKLNKMYNCPSKYLNPS